MAPCLVQRTQKSYFVDSLPLLVKWLSERGFAPIPVTSKRESTRLRTTDGHLVILYHSHSVVVDGRQPEATHALIAPLVREPPPLSQEVLLW